MNLSFRKHVQDAEREFGVKFDAIEDFPVLLDCYRLAEVITGAGSQFPVRPSVELGGVLFHRFSIGAAEWFASVAPWFEGQDALHLMAMAYALAGSRTPVESLWPYANDRARLMEQLAKFRKHLGCTPGELAAGLRAFLEEERAQPMPGDEDAPQGESVNSGYGQLIDLLLSEYGGTPEQWLWKTPRAEVMDLLKQIATRQRAKAGQTHASPDDPKVIAGHRLVMRLRELAESKKAGA